MIKDILSKIFFPQDIKCICCDAELSSPTKYGLCDKCDLDFITKCCLRCGRKMGNNMANYCVNCMSAQCDFDVARAPVTFTGNCRKLIYKLKYGGGKYLAKYLARFMYDCFLQNNLSADVITYVPMYIKKEKARGYNQAKELAQAFSSLCGIQCKELLQRVKQTQNLARMNKSERQQAIDGAIKIHEKVKNLSVLLIDDVFTSGTTSGECARILKKNGAKSVSVLTFASSTEKIDLY